MIGQPRKGIGADGAHGSGNGEFPVHARRHGIGDKFGHCGVIEHTVLGREVLVALLHGKPRNGNAVEGGKPRFADAGILGDDELRNARCIERLRAQNFQPVRDGETCQRGAARKRLVGNFVHRFQERDLRKRGTAVERLHADGVHIAREDDALQRRTEGEGGVADVFGADLHAFQPRAVGKREGVRRGVFGEDKLRERRAIGECLFADDARLGEVHGPQRRTSVERHVADERGACEVILPVRLLRARRAVEAEFEAFIIDERARADDLDVVEPVHRFELGVPAHAEGLDLFERGGQPYRFEIVAPVDGGVHDVLHALRDDNLGDIVVVEEGVRIDVDDAQIVGDLHDAVFIPPARVGAQVDAVHIELLLDGDGTGGACIAGSCPDGDGRIARLLCRDRRTECVVHPFPVRPFVSGAHFDVGAGRRPCIRQLCYDLVVQFFVERLQIIGLQREGDNARFAAFEHEGGIG